MKYTFNVSIKPVDPLVVVKLSSYIHRYMKKYNPMIYKSKDRIKLVFTITHRSDVSFLDEDELRTVNKAKASDLIYFILRRFKTLKLQGSD